MDEEQPKSAPDEDTSIWETAEKRRILLVIHEEIARGADFDVDEVPDESSSLLELTELEIILVGTREMREGKVMTTEQLKARLRASISKHFSGADDT